MTATTTRTPFVSKAPKLGLVGSFDGLRGIGVCMLLVGHALFGYVESWVTIIDAFFVLSGFLITTLLHPGAPLDQDDRPQEVLPTARRPAPAVVVLFVGVWLVISVIATLIGYEKLSLRYVGADALAALTYMYHLVFPNGLYMIEPDGAVPPHHVAPLDPVGRGVVLHRHRGHGPHLPQGRWVAQLGLIMGGGLRGHRHRPLVRLHRLLAGRRRHDLRRPVDLLQRPDALMLGVAIACLNAYLTQERLDRIRKPLIAVGTVGLVVWFVMLNLSSGLVQKLGGPYVDYLPSKPSEFTRPADARPHVLVPVRAHHRRAGVRDGAVLPLSLPRPGGPASSGNTARSSGWAG